MSRWTCTLLAACGFALPAVAQLPPDKALASLNVADGLQVELFAAEPMVINPTSIDVDHLGRVWVCEAVNYRNKMFKKPLNRPEGDRIVILRDKDGDGKADESTVFYQGTDVYGPLGVCVLAQPSKEAKGGFAYRVLVCQSPDILEFWDRDGDGKADGPPKKFLTGYRGFDHDHGVHGIIVGPDGKLYFTVGDQGVDGLQSSDGKGRKWKSNNTDCQAGTVWRCDQDGTNLEMIAHNFRNNYECCVNSFGEIWLSDNDDDGNQQTRICHVMPGGNYGYFPRGPGQSHWHEEQPGIVHKTLRAGFGSPTGICFYEGTLLPEKYRGQLLHTDAGPRELRCFHIKPKGAGYELAQENLVTSNDNWFRLSDVCVAPDGSVMIADWYDPGVGGHGMGDTTRGRIYRVTPKGHKGYKVPEVKLVTAEGLFDVLKSPSQATRALIVTNASNTNDAAELIAHIESLERIEKVEARRSDVNNARLMWYARSLASAAGFMDPTPSFKAYGVLFRSMEQNPKILSTVNYRQNAQWTISPAERPAFFQGKTPAELRELAIGNRTRSLPDKADFFFELTKRYDGQDIFYRAALNIACGTDPERRKAILADFDKHFPEWNDRVADLVWELRPASTLPRLSKLLEDPKLTATQRGRVVDILAVYDDADAGKTMLALLGREVSPEIKSRAIENLKTFLPTKWKDLAKSDELKKAIDDLLKDEKTAITGLQLIAAANAADCVEAIIAIMDSKVPPDGFTIEAIRTLGKLRTAKSVEKLTGLAAAITVNNKPQFRVEALHALAALITQQATDQISQKALAALQRQVSDKSYPLLQPVAVEALAGTRAGTTWLLNQHEKGQLPKELVADAGRLLRNSPFQGERNKALLLFPAPGKLDPKKLPPISELAKRKGDVKRGEAILAASLKSEAQCLRCHTVRGVGGNIGPDQSMIGKKASKENLLESILLPSKAIADQSAQWKVDTIDMKSVTGLLVEETATNITLRDANGKDHTFALKDLDGPKQKSLVSIMPDNLVSTLTEDELIDLVEYMLTLKTASLTPETWHILGPFANDGSDSALDKDLGLESLKAIDLNGSLTGRDGPVKWGIAKVNGSGYLDLMAHYAGKSPSSASYLYRVIDSPVEQAASLLFGNDDGAKLWINGEKAFENRDHFAATPGRHSIPVKLKKGPNAVLIKIVNGSDPHGMYFALTSEQELKLAK